MIANAYTMISNSWTPKNTFTDKEYTDTNGTIKTKTYYIGTTYTGEAYSEFRDPQDSWSEFLKWVTTTAGGNKNLGNDCSGFVSMCWQLPTRHDTSSFNSELGSSTEFYSLGNPGTCANVDLLAGDAMNSAKANGGEGHIVLFYQYQGTGNPEVLEQTPPSAQSGTPSWSYLATNYYQPIRRSTITENVSPTITSIYPNPITYDPAKGYQSLTITGTGFVSPVTVLVSWSQTIMAEDFRT